MPWFFSNYAQSLGKGHLIPTRVSTRIQGLAFICCSVTIVTGYLFKQPHFLVVQIILVFSLQSFLKNIFLVSQFKAKMLTKKVKLKKANSVLDTSVTRHFGYNVCLSLFVQRTLLNLFSQKESFFFCLSFQNSTWASCLLNTMDSEKNLNWNSHFFVFQFCPWFIRNCIWRIIFFSQNCNDTKYSDGASNL